MTVVALVTVVTVVRFSSHFPPPLKVVSKLKKILKSQIVTKLKNSNCYKTPKLNVWQNSKTQMLAKLKNLNRDKTH